MNWALFLFNFAVNMVEQKRKTRGLARKSVDYLLFFGYFCGRLKCNSMTWREIANECIEHFGLQQEYSPEGLVREMRRMTIEYIKEGGV